MDFNKIRTEFIKKKKIKCVIGCRESKKNVLMKLLETLIPYKDEDQIDKNFIPDLLQLGSFIKYLHSN